MGKLRRSISIESTVSTNGMTRLQVTGLIRSLIVYIAFLSGHGEI